MVSQVLHEHATTLPAARANRSRRLIKSAETEALAREVVVSSALGSPSAEEIRLANQADFLHGKEALIIGIDFAVDESSVKLIADAPEGWRP
jgi:hypothetical protein